MIDESKIIKLKSDTAKRKRFFTPESFAHPAKCHIGLLEWIVLNFTEEGEVILDPMLGSGTTLYATLLGRSVIGVELESKFIKMAQDNLTKLNQCPLYMGTKQRGTATILQGDARNLTGILADKIITSPTYGNPRNTSEEYDDKYDLRRPIGVAWGRESFRGRYGQSEGQVGNLLYGQIDHIVSSPPYEGTEARNRSKEDWWDEEREKKMSGGSAKIAKGYQVDKIVSSPPYAEQVQGSRHSDHQPEQRRNRLKKAGYNPKDYQLGTGRNCEVVWEYGKKKGQIGNLPYKVNHILTSPPYEEAMGKKHHSPRADKLAEEKSNPVTYTDKVDHILTSPPYEQSVTGQSGIDPTKMTRGKEDNWKPRNRSQEPAWDHSVFRPGGFQYSGDKENIGNLKNTSYLEAMLAVYKSCHSVLKDSGLLILVVKNFIRNKQEVDLKGDTIKLCQSAGFSFLEEHHRILTQQSFWRTIYAQRFPEAPVIDREYILCFRKEL